MGNIDPFAAQLVEFVRRMPDDAILALVRNQLGVGALSRVPGSGVSGSGVSGSRVASDSRAPAVRAASAPALARPVAEPRVTPAKPAAAKPAKRGRKAAAKAKPAPAAAAPKPSVAKATPKAAAKPAAKAPVKAAAKPAAKAPAKGAPKAPAGREHLIGAVERAVKASSGLAASEVARAVGAPQSRVSAVLRDLKQNKRIFQGGDRRFARYAGDARTAAAASEHARKTASGPPIRKKR